MPASSPSRWITVSTLTPPERFPAASSNAKDVPPKKKILTSRLIDRPIRPLFPEGFLNETQIIAMVLSADPEQDPNSLAIVGAAAALAISDIPFPYVLAGVRVGMKDGKYIANPTYTEGRESKLNIVVAGTEEGIVMVEAGAQQVSEAEVLGAIEFGHDCCKKIAAGIRELVEANAARRSANSRRRCSIRRSVRPDRESWRASN